MCFFFSRQPLNEKLQCHKIRTVKAEEFYLLAASTLHFVGYLAPFTVNLLQCVLCSLVPGYYTCSSRARPVWSYGQSAPWCWAAWPWAPRTTSSPWWTVTSSLPFSKVGCTTHTHACKYWVQRTSPLVTYRDTDQYDTCVLCSQVSCVRNWSSLKLVFDVSEQSSSVQSPLCSCSIL